MEELIKQYFEYRNGSLYWLQAPRNNRAKAGDRVQGYEDPKGYRYTRFKNKCIRLGHIVFFLHYNCFPARLKYLDGDINNIAIENLQPYSQKLIVWGACKRKGEYTSKYKGVFWRKDRSKWKAIIKCNGKSHHIGLYDCEEDAALAYNKSALEYFGSHAHLNKIEGN
ncbi:TPA: hypothetical protein SCS57_002024 [Enterobacter cloacae]|nr:hypothetical protein [Enterobacter cloacae]